jgi:hypothetical protein
MVIQYLTSMRLIAIFILLNHLNLKYNCLYIFVIIPIHVHLVAWRGIVAMGSNSTHKTNNYFFSKKELIFSQVDLLFSHDLL